MGLRTAIAVGAGRVVHATLHGLLRRDASQMPGRVALAIDPQVVAHLRAKLREGSLVVCGTNGKTTTTNLIASALEAAGKHVICNRTGANMLPGAAAALLSQGKSDWAVIEADELSTVHIVPQLRPSYLILLNLFRDQLDRAGEIDHIQDTLVSALALSPGTTLVVCGDDPMSWSVALRARESGTRVLPFGICEDLGLAPERVPEARFCQVCGTELAYAYHTYAQLGSFSCPACDFARPDLAFVAREVSVGHTGVSFAFSRAFGQPAQTEAGFQSGSRTIRAGFGGVYMVYNLLAAAAGVLLAGGTLNDLQTAIDTFDPHNGRLQRFVIDGREVILNLAKNPTGLNQNISMLLADERPKAVFVVVNDNPNDGRDVSWIWDVDFERLIDRDDLLRIMAGGIRAHDVRVRLKYAGLVATLAQGVSDALEQMEGLPATCPLYVLVNYSALAPAKAELEGLGRTHG